MAIDIALVRQWALEAGEIALARFRHVQPMLKAGDELVTQADREVEAFLVERLRQAYPEHGLLGEELGGGASESPYLWALDPIDGTRAFLSGLPIWGISIGLLEHGLPTRGIFYLPLLRECYWVDADGPAFWDGQPLPKLDAASGWDAHSLLCVPADAHRRYEIGFSGITRALGSTAANIIYVARGSAVGALIGDVHIWDIAAAAAILERVGGSLSYLDGSPVVWADLLDGRRARQPMLAARPGLLHLLLKEIHLK